MKPSVSAHQHSDIGDIMITIITRSMHIIVIIRWLQLVNKLRTMFCRQQILQHLTATAKFQALVMIHSNWWNISCWYWQGQQWCINIGRGKFFLQWMSLAHNARWAIAKCSGEQYLMHSILTIQSITLWRSYLNLNTAILLEKQCFGKPFKGK